MHLSEMMVEYLDRISLPGEMMSDEPSPMFNVRFEDTPQDPKLSVVEAGGERPRVVFRQVRGMGPAMAQDGSLTICA